MVIGKLCHSDTAPHIIIIYDHNYTYSSGIRSLKKNTITFPGLRGEVPADTPTNPFEPLAFDLQRYVVPRNSRRSCARTEARSVIIA